MNTQSASTGCGEEKAGRTYAPTIVGWSARLISLALLAALVGTIGWHIAQPPRDVHFTVQPDFAEARSVDGQFAVPFDITNQGSTTARLIRISISASGVSETIEIPMLGHDETVTYVVMFPTETRNTDFAVLSYETP